MVPAVPAGNKVAQVQSPARTRAVHFSRCLVGGEETSADPKITSHGAPWFLHFHVQISYSARRTGSGSGFIP